MIIILTATKYIAVKRGVATVSTQFTHSGNDIRK